MRAHVKEKKPHPQIETKFLFPQNRLQGRGRKLRLRYIPVSSSALRRLRLYRLYRRPSELKRVVRYRSRGRSPTVNVIRANSSPKRQIAKSTKVNNKKKISTNHIKQTIILAKTANIMSPVHGNQNNGASSMINKGSGSIQSRVPQRGSSGSRGQRNLNNNVGMGQGQRHMGQRHGGHFRSNNNGQNGRNSFSDHGRNERGRGNSLNDVHIGRNHLNDVNGLNAGMTGFGNSQGGHNNGIGHNEGHGNRHDHNINNLNGVNGGATGFGNLLGGHTNGDHGTGRGHNMNDLNGVNGGATGFGNLVGHTNGDHGTGRGHNMNHLNGLNGGVSGFGNIMGGQNGGQGHGSSQSQLNSLLQRIDALNILGHNGGHETGNLKPDLLSQLLAARSMNSLLEGSLPSPSGAAELLNAGAADLLNAGISSDVLLGSLLTGNNNLLNDLSVLNSVSPPQSQNSQNFGTNGISSKQNSKFSSLSPSLGITPPSLSQQPVIIKSNGGHLNIGLKKDPNTGKSNIVIQTAAAAIAQEMMEAEPGELP